MEGHHAEAPHRRRGQKGGHVAAARKNHGRLIQVCETREKLVPPQGESSRKQPPQNILNPNCGLRSDHKTSENSKEDRGLWQSMRSAPSVSTPTEQPSVTRVRNGNHVLLAPDKTFLGVNVCERGPLGKASPEDCALRVRETHDQGEVYGSSERGNSLRGTPTPAAPTQSYPAQTEDRDNPTGKTSSAHVPQAGSPRNTWNGEKKYKCQDCGKSYVFHSFFMKHRIIHTGEKPYACQECGQAFRYSLHLKKHLFRYISEKPHTCEECGRAFHSPWKLAMHARIHTGERLYKCAECGQHYSNNTSLKSHLKKHS